MSDTAVSNTHIEGNLRVATSDDDDTIGFVFGYQDPHKFYVFGWNQGNENNIPGMYINVYNEEYTFSMEQPSWPSGTRIFENTIPWADFVTYRFILRHTEGYINILIYNGETLIENISIADNTFTEGRFGFYNASIALAEYSGYACRQIVEPEYLYDVNAFDPDEDVISYSLLAAPPEMNINETTGVIVWEPVYEDLGTHQVVVLADDGKGGQEEQAFTLCVVPPELDLAVSGISLNNNTLDPDSLELMGELKYTVTNNSNMRIAGGYDVMAYTQDSVNSGITVIGQEYFAETIFPGEAKEYRMPVFGTMVYRDNPVYVMIDSSHVIDEWDELNNIGSTVTECQMAPVAAGSLNPVLEWEWSSSPIESSAINTMMTPVIMDINRDTMPDIIFAATASLGGGSVEVGYLRAISGDGGTEIFTVNDSRYLINTCSSVAAGDIDLDGYPEIIACDSTGQRLIAFEHDGTYKWRSPSLESINWGAPSLADMDQDGVPEIWSMPTRDTSSNVTDDGTIPRFEANSWLAHNTYRCNLSDDALACEDYSTSRIRLNTANTPASVDITARIGNAGILNPGEPLNVSFYNGNPASGGSLLGTIIIDENLPKGSYKDVTFAWNSPPENLVAIYVVCDDDGTGRGHIRESDEQNNTALTAMHLAQLPVANAGPNQTVFPGKEVILDGSASYDPGGAPLTYAWSMVTVPAGCGAELTIEGKIVTPDSNNQAVYTSTTPGVFTARAVAVDISGCEGRASTELTFLEPGSGSPPVAEITAPGELTKIKVPTEITGTASSANLLRYTLEYSPKDKKEYILFATGDEPVTGGVPGTIDPTVMINGLYDIRLTATDSYGQSVTDERVYQISGNMKVGIFTLSFNDLTVPVSGIPITVTRTYDSRNKSVGEFGYGWTMSTSDIKIEESCVPGEEWKQTQTGGSILNPATYYLNETKTHKITVTYPDGKTDEFRVNISPTSQRWEKIDWVNVSITPMAGTYSTLEPVGVQTFALWVYGNIDWPASIGDDDGVIFDPGTYRLTTVDGAVFVINQLEGIKSVTDRNGNTLTFNNGSITHSSGKSIQIDRDSEARIVAITDPLNGSVQYTYDGYGDLVKVTDQEGHETRFVYNEDHYLLEIIDPRGVRATRNEYDESGRLVSTTDASGITRSFNYDGNGNQTGTSYLWVNPDDASDTRLIETRSVYDAAGRVLRTVDAEGHETSNVYDATGNLSASRDKYGHTTTYTYNAIRKQVQVVYPDGSITRTVYDKLGQTVATVDRHLPGEKTFGSLTTYDKEGRVIRTDRVEDLVIEIHSATSDSLLVSEGRIMATTSQHYNNRGQVEQITGSRGETTTYEYDNAGRRKAVINHLDERTEYDYDLAGEQETITDALGNVTSFDYDNLGRQMRTEYTDGTETVTEYDRLGRRISETGQSGKTKNFVYAEQGRLSAVLLPAVEDPENGNAIVRPGYKHRYNPTGTLKSITDPKGRVTAFTYDGYGRIALRELFAGGSSSPGETVTYSHDALGRPETISHSRGITKYTYDEKGQLVLLSKPEVTRYDYTEVGSRKSVTLPNGVTTSYGYTNLNRLQSLTQVSGGATLASCTSQLADNGRRTGALEILQGTGADALQNGITYTYDDLNRLTREVMEATGGSYGYTDQYTYDLVGNRLERQMVAGTDRLTTTYVYDANDRLLSEQNAATLAALPVSGGYAAAGAGAAGIALRSLPTKWSWYGFILLMIALPLGIVLVGFLRMLLRKDRRKAGEAPDQFRLQIRCRPVAMMLVYLFLIGFANFNLVAREAALYSSLSVEDWGN